MSKYTTSLETLQYSVAEILDEKLKATSPEQTADYAAFALDNLTSNIERAKQAKRELDAYIKEQTSIIETIKEDTATWLATSGIDRLDGMRISSLTTYMPKPKEDFKILDDDFFIEMGFKIEKVEVDKVAAKAWVDEKYKEFEEDAIVKTFGDKFTLKTTHKQKLIKINKRKK